jgi:hypothetical protein
MFSTSDESDLRCVAQDDDDVCPAFRDKGMGLSWDVDDDND